MSLLFQIGVCDFTHTPFSHAQWWFFFFFLHCTRKFKLSLCLSDHSFCLSVSPVVFPHAASEKKGAPRGGYSRKGRIEKYRTVPITTAINSCSDLYTVEKEEYVDNIEQDDQQPNIQTAAHWKCSSTQSLWQPLFCYSELGAVHLDGNAPSITEHIQIMVS